MEVFPGGPVGSGHDTIEFDELLHGATISLTHGQLVISDDLTISGLGADLLTIDTGNGADNTFGTGDGFRIFNIDDGDNENNLDIEISSITLTGGDVSGDGGAIRSAENLTIKDSTITGNWASGSGGGVYLGHDGDTSNLSLTISSSTISGNMADSDSSFYGGGGIFSWGKSTITESLILENISNASGGGITHRRQSTITDSTISGNTAQEGGGIQGHYTEVVRTSVLQNSASGNGGGIYARRMEISDSIISGNTSSDGSGGGLWGTYVNGSLLNSTERQ